MKRFIALCLALATLVSVGVTASANGQVDAIYTGTAFKADGRPVSVDTYNINNYGYYKLRDIAAMVVDTGKEFSVDWDGEKGMITLTSGGEYTPKASDLQPGDGKSKKAVPSSASVVINGEEVSFTAYNINGFNYFKLRDICAALNIGVVWDESTRTSGVATRLGYYDETPQVVAAPTSISIYHYDDTFTFHNEKCDLYIGQSAQLEVNIYPNNANSGIYWQSSDPSVASVDNYGYVTAHKNGTVTITATTYNDKSDTFIIEVPYPAAKLTYKLTADGKGYEVTGCDVTAYTLNIPATYNDLPVVSIAYGAFKDCEKLRSITVDEANTVFYDEGGVVFTDIPEKTLVCFPPAYDAAEYYYVPQDTIAIAPYAFAGLSNKYLFNITLQEGVKKLGDYAFAENRNWNVVVYIPASLTDIGKDLRKNYYRNIKFMTIKGSPFVQYAYENMLTYDVEGENEFDFVLSSTAVPKSVEKSEFVNTNASEIVTVYDFNYQSSLYVDNHIELKHTIDLTDFQQDHSGEVRVILEGVWSKIRPDIYGNKGFNFDSQSGLYGAGHTDGNAILRGYDLNGNLVAMQYVSGNFAFSFPGAYNLGVESGKNTQLTVIPVEPTYIPANGYYAIDFDDWHKIPNGNYSEYYIVQNISSTFKFYASSMQSIRYNVCDAATGRGIGGMDEMVGMGYSIYCFWGDEPSVVQELDEEILYFDGMTMLLDNSEFACMVNSEYPQTEEFAAGIYDLLGNVKQIMIGKYIPESTQLHKIVVCGDGTNRANANHHGTIYIGPHDDILTYAHEMIHAIDSSITASNKVSPATWLEGRAEYLSMKVCDEISFAYTNRYNYAYDWSFLTKDDKADFARYYYFCKDEVTEYYIGYYFLKYLNETYGEDISMKIMDNIAALTDYDNVQRSEANYFIFKQCVEAATEVGVFQNFVRDVIEK